MRGWMQTKFGLALVGGGCLVLLASCLVNGKGNQQPKEYTIDFPASLPLYAPNDYIAMRYASYIVNGTAESPPNGITGITMRWQLSSLAGPFTGSARTSVLRFTFQDAVGTAVQYITQDSTGFFLHGFGGLDSIIPEQKDTYWPDKDGVLDSPDLPEPVQVFWSPFTDSAGASTTLDINHADAGGMNFKVMGECDSAGCKSLADFIFSEHQISSTIEKISTPLGKFETYHLRYSGSMITRTMQTAPPHFDYRTSCWTPGIISTVTFEGDVWIYPPIGPVKIQNLCTVVGSSHTLRYEAQIVGTNLPLE